jgi:hypothetical protein
VFFKIEKKLNMKKRRNKNSIKSFFYYLNWNKLGKKKKKKEIKKNKNEWIKKTFENRRKILGKVRRKRKRKKLNKKKKKK